MSLTERASELAKFLGEDPVDVASRLARGFHAAHAEVAEDFRRANPQDERALLAWYRTTDAYIWELSAYHLDPGFNYSGMVDGIAAHLTTEGKQRVLCLGDGIGDLTITCLRNGLSAFYHDLQGSRTSRFAQARILEQFDGAFVLTRDWSPDLGEGYDAVVALDFLEHCPNVDEWTQAIWDALNPTGIFLAQNAFAIGSGEHGSIPCHLSVNDHYEYDWMPLLQSIGFVDLHNGWWQRP